MKIYHIAYFIEAVEPTLSGLTLRAESITGAYTKFMADTKGTVKESNIKYIIKL